MEKLKVFISYRRDMGGIAFAFIINKRLGELGIDCFFDIYSMHNYSEDFEKEIEANLHKSKYVIVLLQDKCLVPKGDEDYYLKEIRLARDNKKGIILLPVDSKFKWENQKDIPSDLEYLNKLNLCNALELANIDKSIGEIINRFNEDERYLHYNLLLKMKAAAENDGNDSVLQKTSDIYNLDMKERWQHAKRVSLMAVGCSGVVTKFFPLIKEKAQNGTSFRFLAIDPDGISAKDFLENKFNTNESRERSNILEDNYQQMISIMSEFPGYGKSINYRLTSEHITFTMHWVECESEDENYIYIEFLPINATDVVQDMHPAVIIKNGDLAYSFYKTQFEKCWERAKPVFLKEKSEGCEFCYPPEEDDKYILHETKYWRIYFANNQNYPGRCIIPLRRHCASLSEITLVEWNDFKKVVDLLESVCKEVLGATNFNWTCLMNGGYAKEPYNPHVHFHFIPRFNKPFVSKDAKFIDTKFGDHYVLEDDFQLSDCDRADLTHKLKIKIKSKL